MAKGFVFSEQSAKRVVAAVRKIESLPLPKKQRRESRPYNAYYIVKSTGPSGQADYSNNGYWCRRCILDNSDSDTTTLLSFTEITDTEHPLYSYITAWNLSEQDSETHSVPVDSLIHVKSLRSSESPTITRYFFEFPV